MSTEIIILFVSVIVVPIVMFINREHQDRILSTCKDIIREHYYSLEDLYNINKAKLEQLTTKIYYTDEILQLKLQDLTQRIAKLEQELEELLK